MPDIKIDLSNERIAELERFATAHGKSVSQYIIDAVNFAVAVDKQTVKDTFAPPVGEYCEGCKKLGEMKPANVNGVPQDWRPWCGNYICELVVSDGKTSKCEKCLNHENIES